jgi:hypothetical protein
MIGEMERRFAIKNFLEGRKPFEILGSMQKYYKEHVGRRLKYAIGSVKFGERQPTSATPRGQGERQTK